ncbi:hypothetical protein ES703_121986 [subsurface metagenome]
MKKILGLTIAALLVMALVGGGTWAYFSDVETSDTNIFSAGTLDLNIDGDNVNVNMLTLSDIKPGDTDGGSPGTCELKNVGSITGDLTIVTGANTETESTGTTGTSDGAGTTTTLVDSTLDGSDGDWVGYYLRCTSGPAIGETQIVTTYLSGSGTITVGSPFTAATGSGSTYALHTEYEYDATGGAGVGELGGYVTLSIWLDVGGTVGTYDSGTDVQLLTGNTFNSAAQVFDSMADLASQTWTDCITGLAQGNNVDLYIEWNFADSGDQNDAQGDSVSVGFTFTLNQ